MGGKVKVIPLQESSKNLSVGKPCSSYSHIFNKTEVANLQNQKLYQKLSCETRIQNELKIVGLLFN